MEFTRKHGNSVFIVASTVETYTPPKDVPRCDCDHCDDVVKVKVDGSEEDRNVSALQLLNKEDSDGDGDRVICARNREFNDRTFPSVCHMLCYNRCLILRISTVTVNDTIKHVARAFRNSK